MFSLYKASRSKISGSRRCIMLLPMLLILISGCGETPGSEGGISAAPTDYKFLGINRFYIAPGTEGDDTNNCTTTNLG